MDDATIFEHGDLIAVPTKDAIMFMQVESGQYRMLTGTARDIWQLIDGKRTVADIVAAMLEGYDVDRATCESEVKTFLISLESNGMVDVVS